MRRATVLAILLLPAAALLSCRAPLTKEEARPAPGPRNAEEYLERGRGRVDAAQKLRVERAAIPAMGGAFGWPPDAEAYLDHYSRASDDFRAVLARFPDSAAAPEAQFMLGLVNDHPHLNNFDRALDAYALTVERYPGTPAAAKARQRKETIEGIMK